jgi:hypothetical protein
MSVPSRLLAFLAGLAAVFGLALGVGRSIGPEIDAEAHGMGGHGKSSKVHDHGEEPAFVLRLGHARVPAGDNRTITFRVLGEGGRPVTAYDTRHERDLHLIAVATANLRDFQHVHPRLNRNGTWSVELDLAAGDYRVYADTQPTGAEPMVLEGLLRATGGAPVRDRLPAPATTANVERYAVTLASEHGRATFTVTLDGTPVTDLQPYLGAYAHLVVIREDDLAYLHAHPDDGPAGPDVGFDVEYDAAGRHAVYLDFKHRGVVRTAMFTVDAGAQARPGNGHGDEEMHSGH